MTDAELADEIEKAGLHLGGQFKPSYFTVAQWQQIIAALRQSSDKAIQELRNIANAKRFNRERFRDDTDFADWAQSRCRFTLSAAEGHHE